MLDRYNFRDFNYLPLVDKEKVATANGERLLMCVIDPDSVTGFGFGFKYTPEMAQELLRRPYDSKANFLNEKGVKFYNSRLNGPRTKFKDVGVRMVKDPEWYFQGQEPTCGAWSFAATARSLRAEVDPEAFAQLLNEANRTDIKPGKTKRPGSMNETLGVDSTTIERVINRSEDSGIRISLVIPTWPDLLSYPHYLSQIIKNGGAVLETVNGHFYGKWRKAGLHQIAIVGYQGNQKGEVDLQVLDSNLGELILPAEFVYKCRDGDLSVVRA